MPAKDPEARREASRRYYAKHRLKVRTRQAKHYTANAETILSKQRAAYAANPVRQQKRLHQSYAWRAAHPQQARLIKRRSNQKLREQHKKHRAANAVTISQKQRTYRAANADKKRAIERASRLAHPDIQHAKKKRRQALLRGAAISNFTAQEWREMQEHYDHRCVYCGKRAKGHLTQDHITPVIKGGNYTKHNIVPACRSCNVSKRAGPVPVPIQPLLL